MSRHVPGSRMFQLFRSRRARIARRSRAALRPILGGEPLEPRYALSVTPSVSLAIDKPAMFENANGRLTFTFTRSDVTDRPLWISYEVSGSAQWGGDYVVPTNYPGRIQIHGYAASSILSIDPWPDSTVEPDETVSIRILGSADPDNSYDIGTQAAVTGTILNDDFVVDLVLDGLPEETAPRPNELSPGAFLPVEDQRTRLDRNADSFFALATSLDFAGERRTRLDLNVIAPPGSGNVRLDVLASGGSSMITLWDAPTSGTQVTPTTWAYGNQPVSLWVQAAAPSVKLADISFTLSLADIPSGATAKPDVARATAVAVDLAIDGLPVDIEDGDGAIVWRNSDFTRAIKAGDTPTTEPGVPRYVPDYTSTDAIDPKFATQFTPATATFSPGMAGAFGFRFDVPDPTTLALWTRTQWEGFVAAPDGWWRIPAGREVRPKQGASRKLDFWIEGLAPTGYSQGTIEFRAIADASLFGARTMIMDAAKYTVIDVGIGVDGNRDGTIDFADNYDRQLTFWLNNDRETEARVDPLSLINRATFETENASASGAVDSADDYISQRRDLEDLAALHLLVDPVFQGTDSPFSRRNRLTVGGTDGRPGVRFNLTLGTTNASLRLFRAVAESANAHVKDADVANRQAGPESLNRYNAEKDPFTGYDTLTPKLVGDLDLSSRFDESNANERPSFLFEALGQPATTTLAFTVEVSYPSFRSPDGTLQTRTTTRTHTINLDLRDIKDFYTRMRVPYRVGGEDLRYKTFTEGTTTLPHFGAAESLWAAQTKTVPFLSGTDTVVLVHGWNMTDGTQTAGPGTDWKKAFAETAFKRLYWQGFRGNFTAFDWPTFADQEGTHPGDAEIFNLSYNASEYQAFRSGRSLMNFLAAQKSNGPVHVLAHSMGNVVAAEALRQWATAATLAGDAQPLVTNYIAMQGALSAGAYGDDARDTGDPSGYDFYRYWPASISGSESRYYMQGTENAAGKWINMFNEADRATSSEYGWVGNNRLKPLAGDIWRDVSPATPLSDARRFAYRFSFGGRMLRSYAIFTGQPMVGDEVDLTDGLILPGSEQLPGPAAYEIVAFMSKANAKPIGTKEVLFFARTRNGINIDIQTLGLSDSYADERPGHSFQFNFDAATTSQFWKRVVDETAMDTVNKPRTP